MATRKGIAITAGIAAAIVGASFLVWVVPQSSPGTVIGGPRTDVEVISDVYSRHLDLASSIESDFARWSNGTLDAQEMLARLDSASTSVQQMKRDVDRQAAQEWQRSFDLYGQALDIFEDYLSEIRAAVQAGAPGSTQEIDTLKTEWQDYVEQSVEAMPTSQFLTSKD